MNQHRGDPQHSWWDQYGVPFLLGGAGAGTAILAALLVGFVVGRLTG